MIVATLYTGGCNFRCPFCYNVDLVANPNSLTSIDEDYIFKFLNERSDFLDGICLSGGEPTIYNDLIKFLVKIKNLDMKIKLDTNGANPDSLAEIIKRGLIDYIAMDIKTCLQPEKYKKIIGINDRSIVSKIKESIKLIKNSGIDYEFRTTVVPVYHDNNVIEEIARGIEGSNLYILQNFISNERLLNNNLSYINPYSVEKMKELKNVADNYVKKCKIR